MTVGVTSRISEQGLINSLNVTKVAEGLGNRTASFHESREPS